MNQGKVHTARNGRPYPRGATQHWLIGNAPSGPVHKPRWPRYTRWNWRRPVLRSRALPTRRLDWLSGYPASRTAH